MKSKAAQPKKGAKTSFFSSHWWLWLFLTVFLLRIPLLFEPFTYGDEGIYLTLGQAIRRGLVLYRDIHDNKPPMLYLLAALAGTFSWYRFLYFLWHLATIFTFYKLAGILFTQKPQAVILTTSAFAILSSLPLFEGNIANAENFLLLPTLTGFYLILRFLGQKIKKHKFSLTWLTAGLLFSLAVLFKVPAIFDFLAILLVCLLLIKRENFKTWLGDFFSFTAGFLIPLLITFAYFGFQQALGQYLQAAFFQNLPYLASWGSQTVKVGGLATGFLLRALLVFIIVLILFLFRQKTNLTLKVIIIWFATACFAALLSVRPYPHYLVQVLPPLSLSLGFLFPLKKKSWLKIIPLGLVTLLVWIFIGFHFWYYPNWAYYRNFYAYFFRLKSRTEYLRYFGQQAPSLYETASFLRTHTLPEEKIFVWGTEPSLYALAKRLPVGRYTVSYHIIDFQGFEETLRALQFQPPRWLVVTPEEKHPFPQLENLLDQNYFLFKEIGKMKIFYRLPQIARL
ncbi:hypothetical protein FJZ41_03170 [Candidatus Shapirobacteria bacterium]|nr:hypothetical protein [Candidatus Shapirobacteria bacterium]